MVRSERYKLAISSDSRKPVEMYDLMNDPDELTNLVKDPNFKSIRKELLDNHLSRLFTRLDMEKLKNMNVVDLSRRSKQIEEALKEEESKS